MESFTIFTSSAIVDLINLYYYPQQDFAKSLGMTCKSIWGTEIAFEIKNQKYIVHTQEYFYVTQEVLQVLTPRMNPIFLGKII